MLHTTIIQVIRANRHYTRILLKFAFTKYAYLELILLFYRFQRGTSEICYRLHGKISFNRWRPFTVHVLSALADRIT